MNRPAATRTAFLAVFLLAGTAWAQPEIVKCVDAEGHVTLSDQPCSGDAVQATLAAPMAPATEQLVPVAPVRLARAALPPARALPVVRPQPSSHYLAHDVAMLKAARIQMQLLDAKPALRERFASN
jgi:hypothetical protein